MRSPPERSQRQLKTVKANAKMDISSKFYRLVRRSRRKAHDSSSQALTLEIAAHCQRDISKSIEFYTDIVPDLWTVSVMPLITAPGSHELCVNDAMPNGENFCRRKSFIDETCSDGRLQVHTLLFRY